MADYTVIPDSSLSPGAPARAVDARAMRDNSAAIAEGATGAPRIETDALEDQCVEYDKTDLGLVPPYMESGTIYPFLKRSKRVARDSSRQLHFRFGILGAGAFQFRVQSSSFNGTVTLYLVSNGSTVQTVTMSGGTQYGWYERSVTGSSTLYEIELSSSSSGSEDRDVEFEFAVGNYQSIPRYIYIDD